MSTDGTHQNLFQVRRICRRTVLFFRALEYYFPSLSIGTGSSLTFTIHEVRKAFLFLYTAAGALFTCYKTFHEGHQLLDASDKDARENVLQALTWLACYTGNGKELEVVGDVINLAVIAELDMAKDEYYKVE